MARLTSVEESEILTRKKFRSKQKRVFHSACMWQTLTACAAGSAAVVLDSAKRMKGHA